MHDREKVIKGLNCCAHTDGSDCTCCPYEPYDNVDEDCTALMSMDVLALLKEQDEQKRKWLQAIADNQLANAPTDTMDATQHTYYDGVWNGLQMAWDILTKGAGSGNDR